MDITAVTETWFTKHLTDSCVTIDGYRLVRKDRVNKKGGGVCFYIKNDITYEECQFDSHNVCTEIKWIRVLFVDCVYYIACCYYPPKPRHSADEFICQLRSDLDKIMCTNDPCTVIVTGDFNSLNTAFLENEYGLTQCVQDVTHGHLIVLNGF